MKTKWKLLGIGITLVGILVGLILNNDLVTGMSLFALLFWIWFLGFFYVVTHFSDKKPLTLTDLRKCENVTCFSDEEFKEIYHKETGQCFEDKIYSLMLPDEKRYMEWLKLQATKYLTLKN